MTDVAPKELEAVLADAAKPEGWWQVAYNVACYFAIATSRNLPGATKEQALDWLELAVSQQGAGDLGSDWLAADPDLESLRGEDRFKGIVRGVRKQVEGS